MKFFAAITAFAAVAAAHYGTAPVADSCAAVVTVTVTKVMAHTPSAPTTHAATGPAPYPTVVAPAPYAPAGTGYPSAPVGTGYPSAPVVGAAQPSGKAAPSGTGAYSAPPSQFTGAASSLKVGGVMAAGAVVALFL